MARDASSDRKCQENSADFVSVSVFPNGNFKVQETPHRPGLICQSWVWKDGMQMIQIIFISDLCTRKPNPDKF